MYEKPDELTVSNENSQKSGLENEDPEVVAVIDSEIEICKNPRNYKEEDLLT